MTCLTDVRSEMRLERHAAFSILRAAGALAAGCAAVWISRRVDWLLLAEGVATGGLAWLALNAGRRIGILAALKNGMALAAMVRHRIRAAVRLLCLQGVMIILFAVDRWAGVFLLDREHFGYYALGLTLLIAFDSLQAIATVPAWPIVARRVAAGALTEALKKITMISVAVLVAGALLYLPCMWALDAVITRYLPRYASSTDVMYVVAIAGLLRLCNFFAVYAVLCDMETVLFRRHLLALVLICAGLVGVFGIAGVAATPVRIGLIAVVVATVTLCIDAATALRAIRFKSGSGIV